MSGGSSFLSDTLGNFFSSSNPAPTKSNFMSAPISGIQTSVGAMPHDLDFAEKMMTYTPSEMGTILPDSLQSGLHPSTAQREARLAVPAKFRFACRPAFSGIAGSVPAGG